MKVLGVSLEAGVGSTSQPQRLLSGLPKVFLDQLLATAKTVIPEEHDVPFDHGRPGDGCYFVHQGVLKVSSRVTRESVSRTISDWRRRARIRKGGPQDRPSLLPLAGHRPAVHVERFEVPAGTLSASVTVATRAVYQ